MKIHNYPKSMLRKIKNCALPCMILFIGYFQEYNAQNSYTFTPCGATGSMGPTQTQVNNTYSSTSLNGSVVVTGGIQSWTVPQTGAYSIDAYGAQGGGAYGGLGARIKGDFILTAGTVLKILVGQQGLYSAPMTSGGGGAFVASSTGTPIIVAGGGGGASQTGGTQSGTTSTSGQVAYGGWPTPGLQSYSPGSAGNGGYGSTGVGGGGGGGGFYTNGNNGDAAYGYAFATGGAGGFGDIYGGFGGGGGARNNGGSYWGGGAGGGYSGGAGACGTPSYPEIAGGGGSYNSGTNQNNTSGFNAGAGKVIITKLSGLSIAQTTSILCNGQASAVLTASVTGGTAPFSYTWSTGSTNTVISGLGAGTYSCLAIDAASVTYTNTFTVTQPSALTSTIVSQTNVSCSGAGNGQLSISASGGVPAYTYSWSPSGGSGTTATGLSGGVYTCTVKDANSCTSVKIVTVTEPPPTSILGFATSPTVCYGQTSILVGAGALTYTWTGGAVNGIPFVPAATAVYTVTGTNSSGCNGTATVLITVNALPALVISGQSLICNGNSSTLSASGASSYTWSTSSNNTSIVVTPASTTNYTVSGTNSNGCVNSSVMTVTVLNVSPAVTANASSPTICLGGSTTLYGGGATSYSWSGGVTNGVPFSPGISGIYTVTGFNACGSGTNTIVITVNSLPVITANASNTVVCIGGTSMLNGGGGISYVWTGGVTNGNTFFPSVTSTYTVTGTDANGCQNTASKTIVVNPLPTIVANITNSVVCLGNTTTLYGSGGVSYSWTGGVSDNVPFTPGATANYVVTGTDANGCQNTASKTVTVINVPALTVNASNPTVCQGNSTTLLASGAVTYTWTNSVINGVPFVPSSTNSYTVYGTNTCGTTTAAITVTVYSLPAVTANASSTVACVGTPITLFGGGASTYTWTGGITNNVAFIPSSSSTYTVTGTDSHGCQNQATKSLTVYSLPVVTASASSPAFCLGGSTTLGGGGAISYSWSGGITNNTPFTPTITATYVVTGIDANGCQNTASKTITVYPLPYVFANVSNSVICGSNSTSFYGSGANTYTWSGGITNGAILFPTVTVTYSVTGTNTLTGCTSTNNAYATVTVNPLPVITITASSASVCQGQSVILTAGGANSYTWSPLITNGVPFIPGTTTNYFVTGKNTTTGCSNIAMKTITVNPLPYVSPNVTSPVVCYGTSVIFTGTGADTYTWTNGVVNGVPYTPSVNSTYNVSGTNTLTGCTSTNSAVQTIVVNALPVLNTSTTHSAVCLGGTTSINATGANTYTWSGGVVNGVPFSPTVSATYTVTGLVTVTGCTSTATQSIAVNPLPVITVVASSSAVCQGNTVTLSGSGANTYTWSGGIFNGVAFSPMSTNTYSISGTNTLTGCKRLNAAQQIIIVNINPVVSSTVTALTICSGQTVTFSGSGADTYSWTNGPTDGVPFTPTQTASYYLTGTDLLTGCTSTNTEVQTVVVNHAPLISVSSSDSVLCAGQTCTLSSGSVSTRTWSTGEVGPSIVVSPSVTTSYTVYVVGANTCSNSAIITQTVVDCTGLKEQILSQDSFLIYPNPTSGSFTIKGINNILVNIVDELGRTVKTLLVMDEPVSVQDLPPGIYFITGTYANQFLKQKVIITR